MHVDILTLFPGLFRGWLDETIIARAIGEGLLEIDITNIRDFATDRHHTVDDYPYGGGAGMVMKPDVVFAAAESVMARHPGELGPVVLLTPQGRLFSQDIAREMARERRLTLICGRYEGVDERVREHLATEEISIGDYVLSGGELAAMVVIDAVAREVPGVLGSEASRLEESHAAGLLEYPQYTRPPEYRGWKVPEVLLSGNHGAIARWRRQQSLLRTKARRPDLLAKASLIEEDRRLLEKAEEG